MTIIAASRKKGSQVLIAAPQLTYFPWTSMRRARLTMFHLVEPSYSMLLRALATWLWQLSQQRLCIRPE